MKLFYNGQHPIYLTEKERITNRLVNLNPTCYPSQSYTNTKVIGFARANLTVVTITMQT